MKQYESKEIKLVAVIGKSTLFKIINWNKMIQENEYCTFSFKDKEDVIFLKNKLYIEYV